MTDEEIVIASLKEQQFFGEIVERYEAKLTRYVNRLGIRNAEDQEDVLQDIFVKVYKNLNAFDTTLSFSSWIYRVAHNETISWYRKTNVRPEGHLINDGETIISFIAAVAKDSEVKFDEGLNAEQLNAALKELDEKYRTVLILRYFEHKEYEEISDILKIPVGTVGTLVHRGKHKLRDLLDEDTLRV